MFGEDDADGGSSNDETDEIDGGQHADNTALASMEESEEGGEGKDDDDDEIQVVSDGWKGKEKDKDEKYYWGDPADQITVSLSDVYGKQPRNNVFPKNSNWKRMRVPGRYGRPHNATSAVSTEIVTGGCDRGQIEGGVRPHQLLPLSITGMGHAGPGRRQRGQGCLP